MESSVGRPGARTDAPILQRESLGTKSFDSSHCLAWTQREMLYWIVPPPCYHFSIHACLQIYIAATLKPNSSGSAISLVHLSNFYQHWWPSGELVVRVSKATCMFSQKLNTHSWVNCSMQKWVVLHVYSSMYKALLTTGQMQRSFTIPTTVWLEKN